jgi:hypothetical protein
MLKNSTKEIRMSFSFQREDDYRNLHPKIATYMETFVKHRIEAFGELEVFVADENFEKIRDFCHAQLGVAASYRCFKLEELIKYIQEFARTEEITPIKDVLPIFENYLRKLKSDL